MCVYDITNAVWQRDKARILEKKRQELAAATAVAEVEVGRNEDRKQS